MNGPIVDSSVVQYTAVLASFGWLIFEFLEFVVLQLRGGSPEFRAIKDQLEFHNSQQRKLLEDILRVLETDRQ